MDQFRNDNTSNGLGKRITEHEMDHLKKQWTPNRVSKMFIKHPMEQEKQWHLQEFGKGIIKHQMD